MRLIYRIILAIWLVVIGLRGAWAGPHHPQISIRDASDAAAPPTAVISGLWPDTCVPELEEASFDRGWVLRARAPRHAECRAETSHYSMTVDLAALDPRPGAFTGPEAAPVRFFVRLGDESVYRLLAFALAGWGQDQTPPQPETGLWWPRANVDAGSGPGIGFTIEAQGDELIVIANAYAVSGEPEWFIGSGVLRGRTFAARLYRLGGGQTLLSDYAPPSEAFDHAHIDIEFGGIASATAWLSRAVGSGIDSQLLLRPMALQRYRFGIAPGYRSLAGRWLLTLDAESTALEFAVDQQRLVDGTTDFALVCPIGSTDEMPASCELHRGNQPLGVITEFGIRHLRGRRFDGSPISLTRLR